MYAAILNKDGSLKHSSECQMTFGRKDPECPRCVEMLNGAPPRDGWQKGHYERKKKEEEAQLREIREHDCKKSRCMPICTFGDY